MHNAPLLETPARSGRPRMSRRRRKRLTIVIAATVAGALVATGGAIVFAYHQATDSIVRSDFVLPQVEEVAPEPGEQNILIMGMDSRVDQNGNPLPDGVYEALHAGGADDGGYNANVLMLLHIPEDRSKTVGISIPRDDYVEIAGAPLGVTHSKIKEAYGLAMQEKMNELSWGEEPLSDDELYQQARAAGRQAQIETVSHFLGDVRIDHFVEMTMGGFYHVAEAVAPVSVCLNQATEDSFSGANFDAGVQEIDAKQAMSFVRQRRDTGYDGPFLTDLDRSRRQQAFMISLTDKLQQKSTLMNPKTVWSLVDVTQKHVALDSEFDVLGFLKIAHQVSQTGAEFVTLPIVGFENIGGADVNIVDIDEVQSLVASILDGSYFESEVQEAADGTAEAAGEVADPAADAEETDAPDDDVTQESADEPQAPGTARYDSWEEPIRAGSIPCVN
ncbi:LCP family protein [Leucobacter aridicollis]|uniref:LCP family protein n=1 Tax=Leucobacter aridicollis TaxID=283878 RepID=UPI00210429FA|nr:LCP family protein [Leucobacter aridicollis]UTX53819.1 LCP family protein [Leucobacter aridicollis]